MMTSAPMTGDSLTVLTSHYALLEDAMTTQLGPMAGRIVRRLGERGGLTLKEIAQTLLEEPFQSATTALEVARAVKSNLAVDDGTSSRTATASAASAASSSMEPSVLVDAAIKEMVTRLILHRVVAPTTYQATYELQLGYGLFLHVLHPLIAQCARRRYGEAGEALVLVLRQLAVVSLDAAVDLASRRCPSLAPLLPRAAEELVASGWLEWVDGHATGEGSSAEGESTRKRGREGGEGGGSGQDGRRPSPMGAHPCRLCVPVMARELLHDALEQWVREHYPDSGLSVALVSLFYRSMAEPASEAESGNRLVMRGEGAVLANAYGFPPLALATHSRPMPLTAVCEALRHATDARCAPFRDAPREEVRAALERLATLTTGSGGLEGPLLRTTDGPSAGAGGEGAGHYALSLPAILSALQMDCCERTVFTRHGVLGVRIVKLLLRHHLLEDRTLAEEAVATQPRTRQTLNAMMRDGYVYQQEIPRGAITGDRQPKNSIFLWGASFRQSLLPSAREHVANSLLHATAKLREVVHEANAGPSGDPAALDKVAATGQMQGVVRDAARGDASGGAAAERRESEETLRRAVRDQRNAVGLMACAMALMRMLLIMDYYG